MLSAPVFDVFRKPRSDESITKVEWRTYYPHVKSFENNDVIDITVNQADTWLAMFEGIITIKGNLVVTGGGIGTLTHNAEAYLFDSLLCEDTCVTHLETHARNSGWNYPNAPILNADKTFSMNIPLKHLFSIFNDHQVATWGKQSIRLVKARNDANSVKVVDPRYVIVFFQTKKADDLHEDVTLFDNANIKSIRLALNSDYYPQARMLLDFSKDQYADAHFNYTEFNKSYHNCQQKRALVNFNEFKTRPMFVIDCSRRHLGMKSSTVDNKLEIEATTGFLPLSEIVRNITLL
ncbi:unnamed protein product [Phaedon cochleariae]|uniref:Double jelly roll-like domain-containing protein n=1 Tax=Phaedon cochleariae TaxID=80249 RepID=A0A9N9SL52_PHACE|nr:unnamed protein product [Phaedon cochleariae]